MTEVPKAIYYALIDNTKKNRLIMYKMHRRTDIINKIIKSYDDNYQFDDEESDLILSEIISEFNKINKITEIDEICELELKRKYEKN